MESTLNRSSVPSTLSQKEERLIKKVLSKYTFKVNKCTKVRSAYKVETNKGKVCLKKIKHGKYKAINGATLVKQLYNNNFTNAAKYIKTKQGNLIVKHKKLLFYATEWIDGSECDLKKMDEVINCTKLMAKFHVASKKVDVKTLRIRNNTKKWITSFNKGLKDLEKFKNIIKNKKIQSVFDKEYLKYIDNFYATGLYALKTLNSSEYYRLTRNPNQNVTICHNSFYYQNIIKKQNKYFLVDLDSIVIDLQITDLGKLIRRLMFKSEYHWDFSKAKVLIESYNTVNKLSSAELEVMLALIIFPHKFCKLGRKRFIKQKNWNELRYSHKLKVLIKNYEKQEGFLKSYIEYLNLYQ